MAVVSEPPWINSTSGVAPRNGTTSHTISFGFTPASGTELVFVVYGAVTHAAGWTERLQPVSSGELSVFTKTSAGDTSITVTHNGSNYPVPWAAYEFPAGTSWVGGVGSSPTSDTFPALSGLPGVEVVVFGARGRAASSTSASAASSTVSAPWVEDADLFVADDGVTDGAYLYVLHQINVTATSATPSAATTYSGSWGAPDRQHVTYALNVAAAGGTVHVGAASGSSASSGSAGAVQRMAAAGSGSSTSAGSATAAAILATAAAGASVSAGSAAATLGAAGPVTHQVAASGASTSGGSASLVLRMVATASGASASAGSATPGWLLAASAIGGGVSSGSAAASVFGQVVLRPNTGTTVRPGPGTTVRPSAGVTLRP